MSRWSEQSLAGIEKLRQQGRVAELGRPAPSADVSEKEFQAAVEREARKYGWLFYHTRDSRKSVAGFPDLVMLRGGYMIIAELKVDDNKTDAAQQTWIAEFMDLAGRCKNHVAVYVWYPGDWPEIIEAITNWGAEKPR